MQENTKNNWKSVFSSHINKIRYDAKLQQLHVIWDTGKESVYSGVPQNVAEDVMNSASIGARLHTDIKGKFAHRYN
jgi:hypothetical protein